MPWVFAAKTTLSALLALLIAFTFNLDQPKWAMLTVFIVAQPRSGLVLAKSCYRILGTLVGASLSLLLVALFAQERVLFLGALAMWIGLCTFASQYARNFAAYGFVLSGYTAAIVGIPGALDPVNAFYIAEARVTEIGLGILVTAAISHLIFPASLAGLLLQKIEEVRALLSQYMFAICAGRDDGRMRMKILSMTAAAEKLRASAVFEDHEIRRRSYAIHWLNTAATAVVCTGQALGRQLATLEPSDPSDNGHLQSAIDQASGAIEDWCKAAADDEQTRNKLNLALNTLTPDRLLSQQDGASPRLVALVLLSELFTSIIDYVDAYGQYDRGTSPKTQTLFPRASHDCARAAWAGVRAAIGVAFASAFWIIADWPSGTTAAILASVVAARLATMEKAATVAVAGALVLTLAPIPGFILIEVLLTGASDFEMFALILAPAIFVCALLMGYEASPFKYIVGFLCGLYIPSVGGFQDRISYDPIGFINTSIAIIFAVTVGAILFTVVAPESPRAIREQFMRGVRRLFSRLADPHRSVRSYEVQGGIGDALGQVAASLHPDKSEDFVVLDGSIDLLAIARNLTRLDLGLARERAQEPLAAAVSAFFKHPNRERFARARHLAQAGARLSGTELRDSPPGTQDLCRVWARFAAYSDIELRLDSVAKLVLEKG